MSLEAVRCVLVAGRLSQREAVLDAVQELGSVHLDALNRREGAGTTAPGARQALRWLRDSRRRRTPLRDATGFDAAAVEARCHAIRQRLAELRNEAARLTRRLRELAPWGDFSLPPSLLERTGLRLWFYVVPHGRVRELRALPWPWQQVHRDGDGCYVVVVAAEEPHGVPGRRTHAGPQGIPELREARRRIAMEREDLEAEREALTRFARLLERSVLRLEDDAERAAATRGTLESGPLFVTRGWIAETDLPALQRVAMREGFAVVEEPDADPAEAPTLMRNHGLAEGGEALVRFYATPGAGTWDPSLLVASAFCVFFAMILSDAGYALLLAVLAWTLRRRLRGVSQGLQRLLAATIATSFAWGALAGSWFGAAPEPGSTLALLHHVDATDTALLFDLSLAVGVVHLSAANLFAACARRGAARRGHVAWMMVFAGGALAWFGRASSAAFWAGIAVAGAGLLIAVTAAASSGGWSRRAVDAVAALARLVAAFGDTLSYLRLFALGYAGAALAAAFNGLAAGLAPLPHAGWLLAAAVFAVGHGMNLALGVAGGVVHGLRLNYIEFFNWGMWAEGRPFRPFHKRERAAWSTY